MFYGIEQSTDLRCLRTKVVKFTSRTSLLKWMAGGGGYTYADPDVARNHHHNLREGYEIKGRIRKSDGVFRDRGTRDYPRNDADNLARYISIYGDPINEKDDNP